METLREETQFKQHCLGEKDDQLEEIKGTVTALELKLQVHCSLVRHRPRVITILFYCSES